MQGPALRLACAGGFVVFDLNANTAGVTERGLRELACWLIPTSVAGVESPAMQPTIGRVVHFFPPASEQRGDHEFYAAIVTYVHDDGTVSLATFGQQSLYFHQRVPHEDIADREPEDSRGPFWRWPPRA